MANTVTVSKAGVIKNAPNRYIITLTLEYKDGETLLFSNTYAQEYLHGEAPSKYYNLWLALMQNDINKYKDEQSIFDAAALNTVVSTLQTNLVV